MSQLEFDRRLIQRLERLYSTRDVLRRRGLVRAALGARSGDRILDVGCGPGFYITELLEAVGRAGAVAGVDISADMLAVAAKRAAGHGNVEFHEADAISLPVPDASFERAVCVQVLEYVRDVPTALREMHRVLRPGGRMVVWDVDWATVSWHAIDRQEEAKAWADEQRELGDHGEFFFTVTQFCFTATDAASRRVHRTGRACRNGSPSWSTSMPSSLKTGRPCSTSSRRSGGLRWRRWLYPRASGG